MMLPGLLSGARHSTLVVLCLLTLPLVVPVLAEIGYRLHRAWCVL